MKKNYWQVFLGIALLSLSALLYGLHYLVFRDAHHIFIYLLGKRSPAFPGKAYNAQCSHKESRNRVFVAQASRLHCRDKVVGRASSLLAPGMQARRLRYNADQVFAS
ncbi:MAG TPA: hypothetical protein ENN80_11340 [Candidatus Hydrogenedentes bacterium]|nr:hypothetical protein [Candidatus Hydrogenedentota bacterium]